MSGCSAGVMVRIYIEEDRYSVWMYCWCNGKNLRVGEKQNCQHTPPPPIFLGDICTFFRWDFNFFSEMSCYMPIKTSDIFL